MSSLLLEDLIGGIGAKAATDRFKHKCQSSHNHSHTIMRWCLFELFFAARKNNMREFFTVK
jgi:uncharacterized membrane protein YsdA (DUF1294 family)